jgi:hypothetical protein
MIDLTIVNFGLKGGRGGDKYTEIFVIGGAKITVHAAVVKTKLKARS